MTRKPTHPIRRMQEAMYKSTVAFSRRQMEKTIARHVKPLLDALEESDMVREHEPHEEGCCRFCNLLAGWRAPLD